MSSLHKFHRRTASFGPSTWPATAIGMGDDTHGYWLGDVASNKIIVAPRSAETIAKYYTTAPGTLFATSKTDGLANTNAWYANSTTNYTWCTAAKNLTTGGYNTWYIPAEQEAISMVSNKSAQPFNTKAGFSWSQALGTSTRVSYPTGEYINSNGGITDNGNNNGNNSLMFRPIRRTSI